MQCYLWFFCELLYTVTLTQETIEFCKYMQLCFGVLTITNPINNRQLIITICQSKVYTVQYCSYTPLQNCVKYVQLANTDVNVVKQNFVQFCSI